MEAGLGNDMIWGRGRLTRSRVAAVLSVSCLLVGNKSGVWVQRAGGSQLSGIARNTSVSIPIKSNQKPNTNGHIPPPMWDEMV